MMGSALQGKKCQGRFLRFYVLGVERQLEIDVGAEAGDEDWAAIAVVAGIVDVLEAGGEVDAAPGVNGVVRLDDVFASVVKVAVAEEKTEAAIGEIGLMILLDGVGDEGDASTVLFAMPPCAGGTKAFGEGLVDFGVGEGFGFAVIPAEAGEGGEVVREVLFEVHAESVFAGDVPGVGGDIGDGSEASIEVCDGVAIDAHVGVVGIGQQADDAGLFGNEAVTQFVFEVFGVGLPGLPDEIDPVGDFWHESFGEAEAPVAVFEVGGEADGVAASVSGVVVGAVVVSGPVDELEVSVGANGIEVEKVGHAEFAEAEFEAAARKFVEERQEAALVFDFVFAEGEDFVDHGAADIRRLAEKRVADDIEIGVAGQAETEAESGATSFFEVKKKLSGTVETNARVEGEDTRGGFFVVWGEAVRAAIKSAERRVRLKNEIGLTGEPEASAFEVREHGLGGIWRGGGIKVGFGMLGVVEDGNGRGAGLLGKDGRRAKGGECTEEKSAKIGETRKNTRVGSTAATGG